MAASKRSPKLAFLAAALFCFAGLMSFAGVALRSHAAESATMRAAEFAPAALFLVASLLWVTAGLLWTRQSR